MLKMNKKAKYIIMISAFAFFFLNNIYSQEYFQQKVNTSIDVFLDDENKCLIGDITIEYINNSPNNLNEIYLHLYPNAYKNRQTAYAKQEINEKRNADFFKRNYTKGWIDSLSFFVNNIPASIEYKEADIAILYLPETLFSGDTAIITSHFYVKIPEKKSRLGYVKNEDFFAISQWYPKPAVYDNNGWHPMSYLDRGEFYSEFGDYNVNITIKDNYIVAATGNLETKTEIQKLEEFAKICKNSDSYDKIPSFGNPQKYKTINFTENNVHDFAFFASPNFWVEQEITYLDNYQEVLCEAYYTQKRKVSYGKNSVIIVKQAVDFFSKNIGNYPYKTCKAVINFEKDWGGMEYPGITLLSADNRLELERTITHEIAHNWFYGILANNERNDPWIDEGFTSFYENKYLDYYYPNLSFSQALINRDWRIFSWNKLPARYIDELIFNYAQHENISQRPNLSTEQQSPLNYYANSYSKTSTALYTLEEYLGKENFNNLIKSFYEKYRFTHIYPEKLKTFFLQNSPKDISWFFEDIIENDKRNDYKIKRLEKDSVIVKNLGTTKIPLFITIGDSTHIIDGFTGEKKIPIGDETEIIIDKDFKTIDYNRNNNTFSKGFFRRYKPIKITLANFIDNPSISEIPILPIPAYNTMDGFMLGLAFYTPPIPKRQFEVQLIPLFAFNSSNVTGIANGSLYFHPQNSFLSEIELFANFHRFSTDSIVDNSYKTYIKATIGTKINLATDVNEALVSEFTLKNISASNLNNYKINHYQIISYCYANLRFKNPFKYCATIENGPKYTKAYIEAENTIHYNYKDRGMNLRFFGGVFLYNKSDNDKYNFKLSGNTGLEDYLFSNLYLGRFNDINTDYDNFFAHQFVRNDGSFTLYSPIGQTRKWMFALNFDSNTFIKTIDVFVNLGICQTTKFNFYYEGGIKFSFLRNTLNIYIPLFGSKEIVTNNRNFFSENFLQKIRFTLSLEKLNLLQYRNKPYLIY